MNEANVANIASELTTCKCCGKPLRWYAILKHVYGECKTDGCRRHQITLELNDLAALTEAQVDDYLLAKSA